MKKSKRKRPTVLLLKPDEAALVFTADGGPLTLYLPDFEPDDTVPHAFVAATSVALRWVKEPGYSDELVAWAEALGLKPATKH